MIVSIWCEPPLPLKQHQFLLIDLHSFFKELGRQFIINILENLLQFFCGFNLSVVCLFIYFQTDFMMWSSRFFGNQIICCRTPCSSWPWTHFFVIFVFVVVVTLQNIVVNWSYCHWLIAENLKFLKCLLSTTVSPFWSHAQASASPPEVLFRILIGLVSG